MDKLQILGGVPLDGEVRISGAKNAALPILTVVGIQVAGLLGGTVIIETIFALPGIGRYIYEAIANRDYPVVQGVTIVIAAIFVVVSMTVDILYAVLDPRLRTS